MSGKGLPLNIGELAFRLGRRVGKHPAAGVLFCATERFLPVKRIARTNGLVAFHHPRPISDSHVLIVPTRPISTLTIDKLTGVEISQIIWEMLQLARRLTPDDDVHLVVNGGERQDIGQLHAHLFPGKGPFESVGHRLSEPGIDPEPWAALMECLNQAEQIAGNGYSLKIRWEHEGEPFAFVSQSKEQG